MNQDAAPVRRALISVSDKTGLVDRARRLAALGVEIVSTGGTAKALAEAGLAVRDVSDLTGFPEMMDGRVKTLHPGVHGGLLARRDDAAHVAAMQRHGIDGIDLLWVNLYPFEATLARGVDFEECVENIDIGGPAMIRAAAKNHDFVTVCVEGEDVDDALAELESGKAVSAATRLRLAAKAYARTGAYDAAISAWMANQIGIDAPAGVGMTWRAFGGKRTMTLRYGENPHQTAAFYAGGRPRPGAATARQLQGKELSYNNIADADAAFELAAEFDPVQPVIVIVKHANPCGVAVGASLADAHARALACDPVSAFGGVVAANVTLDGAAAEAITVLFSEVVIAPGADEDAIAVFAAKKTLRLLVTGALPDPRSPGHLVRTVAGGMLVQSRDAGHVTARDLKIVTKREPDEQELSDMLFAWRVAKHVKSNAIVYAKGGQTAGIGAGQMSRVDSARIAAQKAVDAQRAAGWESPLTHGSACASDAFFPFADGLIQAAEAGATAIIQPGGSIRDDEVIEAADARGIAMAFTGMRHFRH